MGEGIRRAEPDPLAGFLLVTAPGHVIITRGYRYGKHQRRSAARVASSIVAILSGRRALTSRKTLDVDSENRPLEVARPRPGRIRQG